MAILRGIKKEQSLADKAYSTIRSAIISNELSPGEVLAEESLAEQLGISRTPIRAALQRLLFEEIVVQRGKNVVVSDVTEQDIRDINAVRMQLEPLSAKLIAHNPLTARQITRLHTLNDMQRKAVEKADANAFLDYDYTFHVTLAEFSGNSYLRDIVEKTNTVSRRFLVLSGTLNKYSGLACDEHLVIIEALEAGDYERASAAIRYHLEKVDDRFLIR